MKSILKKLNDAQSKYDGAVGMAEFAISKKVCFEFSIIHQPSDGWCVLEPENADLAPLSSCLDIINNKGKLTLEDFKTTTI